MTVYISVGGSYRSLDFEITYYKKQQEVKIVGYERYDNPNVVLPYHSGSFDLRLSVEQANALLSQLQETSKRWNPECLIKDMPESE